MAPVILEQGYPRAEFVSVQHRAQLVQRDVRLLLDGSVDVPRMVLDLAGATIATLRLCSRRAVLKRQLPPADRRQA
ncbi:hypothetical protein [Mangrovibrevibacter kandeliae]|uniref:hypothetical protein n=1 Tax=Mangrovibrevibacter kandeliae TaxID=2968473 RepID=UPI0021193B6A|nr:hypothetical protein [Aurantimonas sp. CSK15Z-1]MCQ8781622.1 hypothetical protein [Aurantimonas sp. CSK15Z-1]